MSDQAELEALELTSVLAKAVAAHQHLASRSDFKKPMLTLADKLLKLSEGTPHDELAIARHNLEALG